MSYMSYSTYRNLAQLAQVIKEPNCARRTRPQATVILQAPQLLFLIGANAPWALLPSNRMRNRSSVPFADGCCASNRLINSSS
jgi:hypothetical protein